MIFSSSDLNKLRPVDVPCTYLLPRAHSSHSDRTEYQFRTIVWVLWDLVSGIALAGMRDKPVISF
jgi:hypothetical protein